MENTKYGKRREGRWTPIRAKAQDTRANPNSWETHLVRKRWDIGLLWALSPRIMMMMMIVALSLKKIKRPITLNKCFFKKMTFFRVRGSTERAKKCPFSRERP